MEPEYQDVPELWVQVREAQVQQQKLEELYQEAQEKAEIGAWADVKHLCQWIEVLEPGFRDVTELLTRLKPDAEMAASWLPDALTQNVPSSQVAPVLPKTTHRRWPGVSFHIGLSRGGWRRLSGSHASVRGRVASRPGAGRCGS